MNKPALRFAQVIRKLDSVFREASALVDENRREQLLSYVVLKIHDQWNFRCRQIVFESFGRSEKQMSETLRGRWGRSAMSTGWEPDWHIPDVAIRAARILNVPDFVSIQNALGAVTVIEDVRWTRNAIAHNIPVSFIKFRKMALSKYRIRNVMPYRLILEPNPVSGNTIYEDWCAELVGALQVAK